MQLKIVFFSGAGTPRILFIVPIVYIILNTPFYLFRIVETVSVNIFNSNAFSTIVCVFFGSNEAKIKNAIKF